MCVSQSCLSYSLASLCTLSSYSPPAPVQVLRTLLKPEIFYFIFFPSAVIVIMQIPLFYHVHSCAFVKLGYLRETCYPLRPVFMVSNFQNCGTNPFKLLYTKLISDFSETHSSEEKNWSQSVFTTISSSSTTDVRLLSTDLHCLHWWASGILHRSQHSYAERPVEGTASHSRSEKLWLLPSPGCPESLLPGTWH